MLEDSARFEVVGEAVDGSDAVHKAVELEPDVVVMDFRLPHVNGIEATKLVRQAVPKAQVVMLTSDKSPDLDLQAREAGALAWLPKDCSRALFLTAVEAVAHGQLFPC